MNLLVRVFSPSCFFSFFFFFTAFKLMTHVHLKKTQQWIYHTLTIGCAQTIFCSTLKKKNFFYGCDLCFFFGCNHHRMSKRQRKSPPESKVEKDEEATTLYDGDTTNENDAVDDDDGKRDMSRLAVDHKQPQPLSLSVRSRCVSRVGDNVDTVVDYLRSTHQLKHVIRKYMMRSDDSVALMNYVGSCRRPISPPRSTLSSSSSSSSRRRCHRTTNTIDDDERLGSSRWCRLPTDVWTTLVLYFLGWHECCRVLMLVNRYFLDLVQTTPMVFVFTFFSLSSRSQHLWKSFKKKKKKLGINV